MSEQKPVKPSADSLAAAVRTVKSRGLPPVHLWNPPITGEMDMRIARDGTWFHEGRPINRPNMVRLFSSILKREDGRYFLVTPVEKVLITVEDAPFVAVDFDVEGTGPDQVLTFTTNVGDTVVAGPDNPIRLEHEPETDEPSPYVHVRAGLEALIDRKTFYRMADLGADHQGWFGLWSSGHFFPLVPSDAIGER